MTDFPISNTIYENKVRARVCGLLLEDDKILLLKHDRMGSKGYLWAPPGGGIEFGLSAEESLIKEFLEETNLQISIKQFLFVNEFRDKRHHSVELFFEVERIGGIAKLGSDPELPANEQMLSELAYFSKEELQNMDLSALHNCFREAIDPKKLLEQRGFFKFENI